MNYTAFFKKANLKKLIENNINIYEFSIMTIIFLLILILIKIFI